MEIEGLDALLARFGELEAAVAGEALMEAATEAAEVIRADAAARAPRRTGKLGESIIAEPFLEQPTIAIVQIGPSTDAYWGTMVERGHTVKRGPKGKTKVVGHVPPRPFLRPALDESGPAAADYVGSALAVRLGL